MIRMVQLDYEQCAGKPNIIKASLSALKDFLISTGANVTATLITTAMKGQFIN